MAQNTIDRLIINSPYEEPREHWKYDPLTKLFDRVEGRRKAGYIIASPGAREYDDPGIFMELPLVNAIRPRVKAWREQGYPGTTSLTRRLLEHWWNKDERQYPFFFCQLDALETIIWLTEAAASEKVGVEVPSDGGAFQRVCTKMATGTGKTTVMAMLIAWQVINKSAYPLDKRFTKNVLIITPNLTVKSRLQVLEIGGQDSFYDQFGIVPAGLQDYLRQGKVKITNWHLLSWDTEAQIAKKRSVDKRGVKSDEAYTREVLGEMTNARNILVINDEAHHAWRVNASDIRKHTKRDKDEEEATVWVGGLDRINRVRGIQTCYDFSATPFAPTGKRNDEEALFPWIVSDFGLNDAIESGLVKTPRVVIRDDALPDVNTYRSKLYHIYAQQEIKEDLNRAAALEAEPLRELLLNAYYLLGKDWQHTYEEWKASPNYSTPPVMITVANRTEAAARIRYSFEHGSIRIPELAEQGTILHIDSKVLDSIETVEDIPEAQEGTDDNDEEEQPTRKLNKKEQALQLRKTVDTVGKKNQPGEQIRNVISVGMLSEGWDARTVTHIMGLRAFTSQLLCEQVVGRGLRRTSYEVDEETGLFSPEYVNIFGVPFSFLPHEAAEGTGGTRNPNRTRIEALPERAPNYELQWPNIVRIDRMTKPVLTLDVNAVPELELHAIDTIVTAELAPVVEGKPDVSKLTDIDLKKLDCKLRMQQIIFETAANVFDLTLASWQGQGTKHVLLAQIIRLTEAFLYSDRIKILPSVDGENEVKRRILLMLNMGKIVQHLWKYIKHENTEKLVPVFDRDKPIRSTGDMPVWYTGKPCEVTRKSHISHCVFDSTWEAAEAYQMEDSNDVQAWAKNDHLGFEITYLHDGVIRKYRPDFFVRFANGAMLILEVKGQDSSKEKAKRDALNEWIGAVNEHGGFGRWYWDVSFTPMDILQILAKYS